MISRVEVIVQVSAVVLFASFNHCTVYLWALHPYSTLSESQNLHKSRLWYFDNCASLLMPVIPGFSFLIFPCDSECSWLFIRWITASGVAPTLFFQTRSPTARWLRSDTWLTSALGCAGLLFPTTFALASPSASQLPETREASTTCVGVEGGQEARLAWDAPLD